MEERELAQPDLDTSAQKERKGKGKGIALHTSGRDMPSAPRQLPEDRDWTLNP